MSHNTDIASRHLTQPDDNIFSDLGFDNVQAAELLHESDEEIRQLKAMKKQIMAEITAWMRAGNIKQQQAAEIMRVTRPRVSDVVNQKTEKFTLDALLAMAGAIGKQFQLIAR